MRSNSVILVVGIYIAIDHISGCSMDIGRAML